MSHYTRWVIDEPDDQRSRQRKLRRKAEGGGGLPPDVVAGILAAQDKARRAEVKECYINPVKLSDVLPRGEWARRQLLKTGG